MVRYGCKDYACTIEMAFDLIGGKWKPRIVWWLGQRTFRFRELERQLADTSRKVLVQQLRQLETDGVVHRTVHAQVPPRVDYALTDMGRKLLPILHSLDAWAGEMLAAGQPAAVRKLP